MLVSDQHGFIGGGCEALAPRQDAQAKLLRQCPVVGASGRRYAYSSIFSYRPGKDYVPARRESDLEQSKNDRTQTAVRDRYAAIARASQEGATESCCAPAEDNEADSSASSRQRTPQRAREKSRVMGYSEAELDLLPEGVDMGLGCGNPMAIADLRPRETVVDLGSGGGIDCFLAAEQVGPEGHVIGVDMTPDMLSKARANADKMGKPNVEFRLGEIEHLPIADGTVDVIISNCVINLSPNKEQVFRDAFRVLKRGGRIRVSDVVATRLIPKKFSEDEGMICGCMGGAATVEQLRSWFDEIGFVDARIDVKEQSRAVIKEWMPGSGIEEYVASAEILARKPE